MDAFFASVELLRYPDLRGQPVVVGGSSASRPLPQADGSLAYSRLRQYVGRGVATTSTYEARALGVFSGMGLMKSAQLAPDAILLPANFDAYRHYSRLFKEAVAAIAPQIEDRGIDEIYIDLTAIEGDTRAIALGIKSAVGTATGLSCSIGVAPNKLLAKICSDLDKPDGLTILEADDDQGPDASNGMLARILPLPVRKINGIGPKANEKLAALGIHTIGELAGASEELLAGHFGRGTGAWLHRVAHGIDDRPVVTHSEPLSISRETTFERDLHARRDKASLSEVFSSLCLRLAADLERKGYAARTIGIKLRFEDFRTVTRDLTLSTPVADAAQIRRAAGECLRRVSLEQRIRLLGVRASALCPVGELDATAQAQQQKLPFEDR